MTYDFDTPIDRSGTYSLKWEEAGDALPMWVADMDFQTAPVIREALRRRVEHGVFGYSIVPPEWNQAYVDWWGRRHGLAIDPDSLVFCTGVVPANAATELASAFCCSRFSWLVRLNRSVRSEGAAAKSLS